MNIAQQIAAFEAKRLAHAERMEAIMTKAAEEGRSLDEAETEEYDGLDADLKTVDEHLVRLRKLEKVQVAKAAPVKPVTTVAEASDQRGGIITVKRNLPPGIEFARYAICVAAARGNLMQAHEIAKARYPDESRVHNYIKTQVAAGTTQHTTWAAPLAQADAQFVGDFVEYLRPATIIGKFGQNGVPALRAVPFNVSIAGQTSGGGAGWVGEGSGKPLTKFAFQRTTMPFTKIASIAVITDELLRFSSPSAEALVRDQLSSALIQQMDSDFADPANSGSTGVKPASITYGSVATATAATGTTADYVRADVKTVMNKFIALNISLADGVWIMPATSALSLSLMFNTLGQQEFPGLSINGGTFMGLPVIVSQNVQQVLDTTTSPNALRDIIILASAGNIWLADDGGVSIDASREASLEMDTAPSMKSAGSGSPEVSVESTTVSMFQTNSVAIRAEREIHWKTRRTGAVQYIKNVKYA